MRTRIARTFKGDLEQNLFRSSDFRKRLFRTEGRVRTVLEELNKASAGSPRFDQLVNERDKLFAHMDRLEMRIHDPERIKAIRKEYEELPTIYKARNEIRHRLVRDYKIRSDIANVASVIKMVKGYDDLAAISRAKTLLSDEMLRGELKEKDYDKEAEIADDILLNGESSKYLKRLNQKRNYI
jgi:hypothetical protein